VYGRRDLSPNVGMTPATAGKAAPAGRKQSGKRKKK